MRLPRKLKKKQRKQIVMVDVERLAEKLIFGHIIESMEKIRVSGEWRKLIGITGPSMDEAIAIKRKIDQENHERH